MNSLGLGPITQIAYVVPDLHEGVRTWVRSMSVGPFFVREHVQYVEAEFEGEPCHADLSLAFAYSGDLQIELIQQHNDVASIFIDRSGAPIAGLHHVGVCTLDLAGDEARQVALGRRRVQRGLSVTGTETVFLAGGMFGILELIQLGDKGAFFERMKDAAQAWDGVTLYGA